MGAFQKSQMDINGSREHMCKVGIIILWISSDPQSVKTPKNSAKNRLDHEILERRIFLSFFFFDSLQNDI